METSSCLRAVVTASTQYRVNPSDANLTQLLRQLDVLISVTSKQSSLKVFEPKQLLPTECITGIIEIFRHPDCKKSFADKALILFSNLANDACVRQSLHHIFHLTPALANCLLHHVSSQTDSNALLCLKLLQRITYNVKVNSGESYVDDLLKLLVKNIQSGQHSEVLYHSLAILTNLCRQNFSMQNHIKNMENVRSLYRTLMGLMSHSDMHVTPFALSILASLCIHDQLGETLFNAANINTTFQLMVNMLVKSENTRKYVVDIFLDLLRYTKIRQSFTVYQFLDTALKKIMGLLTNSESLATNKVLELLLAFCSINEVRCVLCSCIMNVPVKETQSKVKKVKGEMSESYSSLLNLCQMSVDLEGNTPILALELLREIYQEMLDLGLNVPSHLETMLPLLMECLVALPSADKSAAFPLKAQCLRAARAAQLLTVLYNDESMSGEVCKKLHAKTCQQIIEWQCTVNPIILAGQTVHSGEEQWCDAGVELVLYTMNLMLKTHKNVPNMDAALLKMLQEQHLIPFLSLGIVSPNRDLVQIALGLLSKAAFIHDFPTSLLGDSLVSLNIQHNALMSDQPASSLPCLTNDQSLGSVSEKENRPILGVKKTHSNRARQRMSEKELEQSVTTIIEKMQTGLELKDVRASEMISVYEHRLQSLETKENHLQDLLEAKSLALEQADRLIAQYRSRRAHTDAESHKLRSIVQDTERRIEELREEVNEGRLERERINNDMEQLIQDNNRLEVVAEEHKDLTERFAEQTQRLENTQRTLTGLKQDHNSLSEMHEMLKRHNDTLKQQHDIASQQLAELEEERKNLSKQLKEREQKVTELSKQLKKTEDNLKKISKDRDSLEKATDDLRNQLHTTEQRKEELKHQVSSLELVCRQHEMSIAEKEESIKTQKTEIDKQAQVAALIRNLTSGMSPGDMLQKK